MHATVVSPFARLRSGLQQGLLADYDELIPRTTWDRARIRRHQRERLHDLLRHAAAHSPFHAHRLAGLDPADLGPEDLSALPVMTKADLMAEFDDVVTDRRVTRAAAEAALAAVDDQPAVVGDGALVLTSGGSSGPRGVFVLDAPAQRQFLGSLSRALVARLRVTGAPPGGLHIAFVAAASPVHATRAAVALTEGGALPFHFSAVPVTLPVAEIVRQLDHLRPQALYGYPSMLALLAEEQVAGRLHIAPVTVTCTSETLTPDLRSRIREGFGAPVIDSFGSTEGLVGGTLPDDPGLVFAEDGCIVELVDEHDRPVPLGTPSASVLVTVLENRLQPLIRYRITDSFVELPPVAGHGYLRARVEGRSDDVLRFGGVVLHPLVMRSVLVHASDVVDYQVRQTPRGIAVDVLAPRGVDADALRTDLTRALAEAGLRGAEVTVSAVPDLPRDARTGKLRRFVPMGAAGARQPLAGL
ncbi:phenylacetate--CoA ligase family protein [Petropleomorpha daqingensis]|uniref:Phenylacetate-coenzyme A ligase PaaK-like adenylate-forming protein n=1 Tax=Petropleomorpha daqingensis TaxID=2026353 RepID=A0A853C9R9_9ACTN|nr:AMP-binding protein [Petropleomorpha daqingensis]NYJ03756.1 phenylacetate-coenzyme A ligase PaaK-like adenylate-forming protein [Petropleomorpha daqingensis]